MTKLSIMSRAVSDNSKIQGNSLPEIARAWRQCTLDLADDPAIRDAANGALRDGNLLNAFLLDALSCSDDERRERAIRGLKMLEALKARDQPLDLRRMPREEFRALGGIPDQDVSGNGPPSSAATRRGRRAPAPEQRSKRTG